MFRICFSALLSLAIAVSALADVQPDVAQLAAELAPKIKRELVAKFASSTDPLVKVAVFPFGNEQGKISPDLYAPNKYLQGELIIALRKSGLPSNLFVLDKGGLARLFQQGNTDPASIDPSDPVQTAKILDRLGIGAAVLGTINAESYVDATAPNRSKVNVTVTLVFRDGTVKTFDSAVAPHDPNGNSNFPSPGSSRLLRFGVELFAFNPLTHQYEPLQLITSKAPGPSRVLFCIIPDWVPVGTPDARYKIRLSNRGMPPVGGIAHPDPVKEQQRLFSVALLIDGVNSFYQDQGDGTIGPVIRHPKNCDKWILSGPGYRIVPDPSSPNGYRLQSVQSKGHSVIDVPGFQKNDQYADAFLFVKSGVSVAEAIGITNDVGVIEAHFYAQKLPGDTRIGEAVRYQQRSLGTGAGPQVENPVFAIHIDVYKKPVSVVRIFYGRESDCPIPKNQRIPVTRK